MAETTLGVIVGHREAYPDRLVAEARADYTQFLRRMDIDAVMLGEKDTKLGAVRTLGDARKCADLFRKHRDVIDGVLVVLPSRVEEKGVADALKFAGLDVPVLVLAYPDELDKMDAEGRRDAFAGKISVCNNLDQAGILFTLTANHVMHPEDDGFEEELDEFEAVCRVVKGMRRARIGAIGARLSASNTMRYSEKILEANGIGVTTVDLADLMGRAERLGETPGVEERVAAIRRYVGTKGAKGVSKEKLTRMAKLAEAISEWMGENELGVSAVQCWPSVQEKFGVSPCTVMSMMSENMMPSACETDVTGALMMYALQLASNTPSALANWGGNYGEELDSCVLSHCGAWAKCFLSDARITTSPVLGRVVGEKNTVGTLAGRAPGSPLTFGKLSTDDRIGTIRGYVGQGLLTNDSLETFGARAVAHIMDLDGLMDHVCKNGFEHHVAISGSFCARVIAEAFETYLRWDMYWHEGLIGE